MPHEANVNILLVDDQRENLLALEVMLDSLGQNLVKAYSGEEALRHLLERDFAVILLDAQMPEMDGFEIVKLIREKPASQHTPIILIADCNQDDIDIERAYSLGIVDYLKKPIAPSILRTKVGVFVSLFKKIEQSKQQAAKLEADNKELQREIAKRQQAEEAVRQSEERYRLLLESIPDAIEEEERTAQLRQLNEQLVAEILERQQVEIALRESEEKFRQLAENIRDVFWMFDPVTERHLYVSPTYERVWGCTCESLYADPYSFTNAVHPEDQERVSAVCTRRRQAETLAMEFRLVQPNGEIRWIYDRCFPVRNQAGQIYRMVGIAEDITKRKQAELALQQLNQELELRVQERTAELQQALERLQAEVRERRQAEEALRASEALFKAIVQHSYDIITLVDENDNMCYQSPSSYRVMGYSSEPLPKKRPVQRVHPEDIPKVQSAMAAILAQPGVPVTVEYRMQRVDGSWAWLESVGTNWLANPDIKAVVANTRDMSDRKQAEEKLRYSEASLAEAQKLAHVGNWEFDIATQKITWSTEVFRIFGLDPEQPEPTYLELLRHSHLDDRSLWEEKVRKILNDGIPYELDHRIIRPDGSVRYVHGIGQAVLNENGQVIRLLGIVQDVTDRKQVEEALRQARDQLEIRVQERTAELIRINASLQAEISDRVVREQQLRAIFECALDAIAILDDQGTYVEANPAASHLYSLPLPELLGKRIADFIKPDLNIESAWRTFQEQGQATGEFRLLRPDGTVRDVEYAAKANFLPGRHLAVLRDITEQKQAGEMRRALKAEKELRRLQLRFFSMVSHEFRTPLSTILGSAQLLKSYTQAWSEEKKCRNLNRIETAAKNMTQLLDDLLTINRAETGKLEFHPRPIELEIFCHQLVEDFQFHVGSKHQITFVCQGQCPRASLDEKLLRSILTNLLSNAVKYSHEGGEVNFTLTCEQSKAIFRIQDQGIGIPPEDQQHLFELFHRGSNIENIPGTGLGLSVVKKCLELQRGKISITSEVGVGTTVTVTIPLNLFMGIP